jgi:hypothetical protein
MGDVMRMMDDAVIDIKRALPHCTNKAGQRLAAAVIVYKGIVNDYLLVTDELTIKYDALRRKDAVLRRHYGVTDEMVKNLVLEARSTMSKQEFWTLGESTAPELLAFPV